jgi:predicted nucleic acid-binding protein
VTDGPATIPEDWIVDSGPTIILAKIGRLDLLTSLARDVLLPSPVVREIRRGPASGAAQRAVASGWGTRVTVSYIRSAVRSVSLLGIGEQSVLTLALKRPGSRAVLDDGQARKAAKALGIPLVGTVGVIVAAKRRGLITEVVSLFHAIQAAGMYVDDGLLRNLAANEGEAWP